ncbi:hypothetical protein QMO17_32620, partial [Klebsiella pneumoniae]|nr:hypothetical protein [Klebsiella pneumoniae]
MRVLHIVHRILVVLFQREVDVEHEFRVRFARNQEEAHGVTAAANRLFVNQIDRCFRARRGAALPFDQVAYRHVAAGALGDLHLFAVAHNRDHLVQDVVGIALWNAYAVGLQAG